MVSNYKIFQSKILYIFFVFLSLNIFFFSTTKVESKPFDIDNIEISKPFEINFNKNMVIDEGFKKAFSKLISLILNSSDQDKINQIKLNEIKGMVETFSIKEEKFIDEIYYMNLGVSFNKKKVFNFLEQKNIFPSIPLNKKIFFLPVIIDENKKELLVFSNNIFFTQWNKKLKNSQLLEYILPTEDLEDLNLIKNKFENIEQYNFEEIVTKYNLEDSIIALIFKNEKEVRVLSKVIISDNVILKNQSFDNINISDLSEVDKIIDDLKILYEDHWKNFNQVNTSIRLTLNIMIKNSNNFKTSYFEKVLNEIDLVYDFFITKFDKNFIYYQIIYNGTPKNFLEIMNKKNYNFNTQNKVWLLQ